MALLSLSCLFSQYPIIPGVYLPPSCPRPTSTAPVCALPSSSLSSHHHISARISVCGVRQFHTNHGNSRISRSYRAPFGSHRAATLTVFQESGHFLQRSVLCYLPLRVKLNLLIKHRSHADKTAPLKVPCSACFRMFVFSSQTTTTDYQKPTIDP